MARNFFLFLVATFTLFTLTEFRVLEEEKLEKQMTDQIDREDASKAEQKAGLFEGDIVMDRREQEALTSDKLVARDAVTMPKYLWKDGKFYYSFHSNLSPYTRTMIHKAFRHIELHTCVTFHKYSGDPKQHYVEFFTGNGCYSRIGRSPSKKKFKQRISIGHGCERLGTIVHESMHALGFFHEHTRQDRDKYVHIKWEEIIKRHQNNFKKYPRNLGSTLGKPYDYLSVMHYSKFAFAKNGRPTIIPTKLKAIIGQRYGLSYFDAYEINKLYKCDVGCKDRLHPFLCRYFKHRGRCNTRKCRRFCKRTCRKCPDCKDRIHPSHCLYFKHFGLCNTRTSRRYCKRTCGKCHSKPWHWYWHWNNY